MVWSNCNMRITASLLALVFTMPASAATITGYLEPVPYSYVTPRRCCPSRYAALTGWSQHKRCAFREVRRGGAAGGSIGGVVTVAVNDAQTIGVAPSHYPITPYGVSGSNGGGSTGPTHMTLTPYTLPPSHPVPAPVIGTGVAGWGALLALAVLVRLRKRRST